MSEKYLVSVVLVTYNADKHIVPCLKSVLSSRGVVVDEVIVVDNASSDDTVPFIEEYFGADPRVKVVRLHKNLGFPLACNIGVINARNEFVVIMNPDTLVEPDCFYKIIVAMLNDERFAIAQPKILHPTGYIDSTGGLMDFLGHGYHIGKFEIDNGQYDSFREVFYATFAYTMVRRNIYLRLACMDSRYYLYNEDLDFCWRVWLSGYKVIYIPDAVVYHVGHHATSKLPYHAIYFGRRNRLFSIFTNYPLLVGIVTSFILLGFYIMLGVKSTLKDKVEARLELKIVADFFRHLKYLTRKRRYIIRNIGLMTLIKKGFITFKLIGLRLYLAKYYRSQLKLH